MIEDEYFVVWKADRRGPFTGSELRKQIQSARINALAIIMNGDRELTLEEFLALPLKSYDDATESANSEHADGDIKAKPDAIEPKSRYLKSIPKRQIESAVYDPTLHLILVGYGLGLVSIFFLPIFFGLGAVIIASVLIVRKRLLPGVMLLGFAVIFGLSGIAGNRTSSHQTQSSALNAIPMELPDLRAATKPAVVHVVAQDLDGETIATGSGFFVAPYVVVTNLHVIDGASTVKFTLDDGTASMCENVVEIDMLRDLAVLRSEAAGSKFLPIDPKTPSDGERVAVIGSPMGFEGTLSEGIVSAIRSNDDDIEIIQISAPISPGSSGSPVVNRFGNVVGVATMVLEGGQAINFAVSGSELLQTLNNSSQNQEK